MTIAEVVKKYGLNADTLRYYERVGLIPTVNRKPNGIRDYNDEDCRWVEFIKCMRSAGIQIEALIEYVALFQQGDSTNEARIKLLVEQRDQLEKKMEDIKVTLERLNFKIERYSSLLMPIEDELKRK